MGTKRYDIIIIGGGPAGASCALALKKSGLSILLVDKEDFPRDKICGDTVPSDVYTILKKVDPECEKQFKAFERKSTIKKIRLCNPRFDALDIGLNYVSHCIRRIDFDHWLLRMAMDNHPSLTVQTGSAVHSIQRSENLFRVTLLNGEDFITPLVIGCDGAQSLAAKSLGAFTIDRQHYSAAVRRYYQGIEGLHCNTSEVYFLKGYLPGYFWIFPLSENQANVGFGMLSATIAKKKINLQDSLSKIITEIPEISKRFKNAVPLDKTRGFGLPLGSKKRAISGDGFMLCGDAASLIDPFTGEGIASAMKSGVFAAEQAAYCYSNKRFDSTIMKRYDEKIYSVYWNSMKYHYYLQRILSDREWLINGVISIAKIPAINRRLMRWFY